MSSNTDFDDSEKIQILIKKAFLVPSTYESTAWYNESKGVAQTILEAGDINTQVVPVTPIWNSTQLTESELAGYGIRMNPTYGGTSNIFANSTASLNINSIDSGGDFQARLV